MELVRDEIAPHIAETPLRDTKPFVALGRVGSREVEIIEADELPVIAAPDGSVGITSETIRRLAVEMDSESVLWIRPTPTAEQDMLPAEIILAGGNVRVDMSAKQVFVEEEPIRMSGLNFRVLEHLCQRAGCLVSREELKHTFWGGYTSQGSISVCIKDIRVSLGDYRWILQTRHGLGYIIDDKYQAV